MRSWRTTRAALAGLGATMAVSAGAPPAHAEDALRGKRLYLDTARVVGSAVSCVDCHGGLPGAAFGIERAAHRPDLIENAIAGVPAMAPLRDKLSAADLVDLASYLGDPTVPSPELRAATRPGAGPSDRIEFGALELGGPSRDAELELSNAGQVALSLTGAPSIADDAAGAFTITATSCAAGTALARGDRCTIGVRFHPTGTAGPRRARLLVPHDWVLGAVAVALLAETTEPSGSDPGAEGAGCTVGPSAAPSGPGRSTVALALSIALLVTRRRARRR